MTPSTPLSHLPGEILREIYAYIPYAKIYRCLSLTCRHFYQSICLDSPICKKLLYIHQCRTHNLFTPLHGEVPWELLYQWHNVQRATLMEQRSDISSDLRNISEPHSDIPSVVQMLRHHVPETILGKLHRPIERRLSTWPNPQKHAAIVYSLREGMLLWHQSDVYQIWRIEEAQEDVNERRYHKDTRFKVSLRHFEMPLKVQFHKEVFMRGHDTCLTVTPEPWERKMFKVYCVDKGRIFCKGMDGSLTLPRGAFGKALAQCEEQVNLFTAPKKKIGLILVVYERDASMGEQEIVGFCCKYLMSARQARAIAERAKGGE